MKRIERQHLKKNEFADRLQAAREFIEPRSREITIAALVIVLVAVATVGIVMIRRNAGSEGERQLAEAMAAFNAPVVPAGETGAEGVPAAAMVGATGTFATEEAKLNAAVPKLKQAADAYPDSTAGITARYHLAGALASLGRTQEAIDAFTAVMERAGADSLYGRMARLGRAETQAQAGQLDAAIATWKELVTENAEEIPVDAILMGLARAYVQKGDTAEARKTFTQLVDQHPDSTYTAEARAELENLKG
jgi:tetratricopeptide (TPR) repeat protein